MLRDRLRHPHVGLGVLNLDIHQILACLPHTGRLPHIMRLPRCMVQQCQAFGSLLRREAPGVYCRSNGLSLSLPRHQLAGRTLC